MNAKKAITRNNKEENEVLVKLERGSLVNAIRMLRFLASSDFSGKSSVNYLNWVRG